MRSLVAILGTGRVGNSFELFLIILKDGICT
jgi:hypothetical protein